MLNQRNKILSQDVLLEGWSRVVRVVYMQTRSDGGTELQQRDLLNRGDSVAVLLHNPERRTVLLLRQPRVVATLRGDGAGETIEACRGQVQDEQPSSCAYREAEEEVGHRPARLHLIASVYPSPGASLELLHIFFGEYNSHTQTPALAGVCAAREKISKCLKFRSIWL